MAVDIDIPDFDLLGDLNTDPAQPALHGISTAPAASAQPQSPKPTTVTPRPVLRLPSLPCTASKVPAALSCRTPASAAPSGAAPLHVWDLNGAVSRNIAGNSCGSGNASVLGGSCDGGRDSANASAVNHQTAGHSRGFKAPRLQPPGERAASCLQTVSRSDARHGGGRSSAEQADTAAEVRASAHADTHIADDRPPGQAPADQGGADDAAQHGRASSKRPHEQPSAAGSTAATAKRQQLDRRRSDVSLPHACDPAPATPAEVTPPQAPEPRRLSGTAMKGSRRTSSGRRPQMRRMYTHDDPLDAPSDPEEQALLEADLPPSERTSAPVMQREAPQGTASVQAEPQRSFKRLRKAGAAPQNIPAAAVQPAVPAAAPASEAAPRQPGSDTAGGEPACDGASGGVSAALSFDTPLPDSRPRHNPFAKSKRKGAEPVRLAQDAPVLSVSAATLRGVMDTAVVPTREPSGSEEEDWPEATGRASLGGGSAAHAGGGSAARNAMARSAAIRRRQQQSQRRHSAAAAPALGDSAGCGSDAERAAVIAETRAAAAAAGIDLTGDDEEAHAADQQPDPPRRQWQQDSAGGRQAAVPRWQESEPPDAQQADQQSDWRQADWADGGVFGHAGGAAAPAQQPAAEAGPWRQHTGAAGPAWSPDLPDVGGSGSAGGGEPWYMRLPDFLPVGAIDNGRNPRNGDAVYIDYLRQFSGEKAPRAARGSGKDAGAARGGADAGAAAGGAAGGRQGHWLTKGGAKVYVDAKGKRLTGRAAWSAYSKDTGKKGSRSGGGGGGVRKRRTKSGGGGRQRKGGGGRKG